MYHEINSILKCFFYFIEVLNSFKSIKKIDVFLVLFSAALWDLRFLLQITTSDLESNNARKKSYRLDIFNLSCIVKFIELWEEEQTQYGRTNESYMKDPNICLFCLTVPNFIRFSCMKCIRVYQTLFNNSENPMILIKTKAKIIALSALEKNHFILLEDSAFDIHKIIEKVQKKNSHFLSLTFILA